jgi:hypothetical protein
MDAGYCGKLQDDRNTTRQCNEVEESDDDWDWLFDEEEKEENPYAKRIKDFLHSLNGDEHRVLDKGEILKDGDEVYVGFGDWMTLYIPHWIQQTVNDGTYRRKVANCDHEETCDSEKEPQVECDCGRRYIYHWLYGWICEDCDLKHQDPYNQ